MEVLFTELEGKRGSCGWIFYSDTCGGFIQKGLGRDLFLLLFGWRFLKGPPVYEILKHSTTLPIFRPSNLVRWTGKQLVVLQLFSKQ